MDNTWKTLVACPFENFQRASFSPRWLPRRVLERFALYSTLFSVFIAAFSKGPLALASHSASFTHSPAIPQGPLRRDVSPPLAGSSEAVEILLKIAPQACTCEEAPFPEECSTAYDAMPHILKALHIYSIDEPGEIAAVLALMAFVSGEFKYNIAHFPTEPGRGTRNMQSIAFNLQYAASIPELAAKLNSILYHSVSSSAPLRNTSTTSNTTTTVTTSAEDSSLRTKISTTSAGLSTHAASVNPVSPSTSSASPSVIQTAIEDNMMFMHFNRTLPSVESITVKQADQILALVKDDEYTFRSAAWFLTSQCSHVREMLQLNSHLGFMDYMRCAKIANITTPLSYWYRGLEALGVEGESILGGLSIDDETST